MLLGLTQQIGKVIVPSKRSDNIWTGIEEGGRIALELRIEGDIEGETFVALFDNAMWASPPVQIRSFSKPGQYLIDKIPPGTYVIGAMIGKPPTAAGLGVHRVWPESVNVRSGASVRAEILVSPDFLEAGSRSPRDTRTAKAYSGQWDSVNPANLLQGILLGPDGSPIPYGRIMIREYNPGARGIAAPDTGGNEAGKYYFDGMSWPYRVLATWKELQPSSFGMRFQTQFYNKVLQGPQTVDFHFE